VTAECLDGGDQAVPGGDGDRLVAGLLTLPLLEGLVCSGISPVGVAAQVGPGGVLGGAEQERIVLGTNPGGVGLGW